MELGSLHFSFRPRKGAYPLGAVWLLYVVLMLIPRTGAAQGDPVGPEFQINTYTTSFQWNPAVASDSSGNFVVVWQSYQDGSSWGVFGQRYVSTGAPLGTEFRVNTYTTNGFHIPAVASDSSGNFVVVWQSADPVQIIDIFGQRFSQIVPSPSWREPAEPVEP